VVNDEPVGEEVQEFGEFGGVFGLEADVGHGSVSSRWVAVLAGAEPVGLGAGLEGLAAASCWSTMAVTRRGLSMAAQLPVFGVRLRVWSPAA
jgi:hypothetical protein